MRAVLIAILGVAASLGAWALSSSVSGVLGAALFILAILIVPVTVGLSIGLTIWRTPSDTGAPKRARPGGWISFGQRPQSQSLCRECGTKRTLSGGVWVCASCDQIATLDAR